MSDLPVNGAANADNHDPGDSARLAQMGAGLLVRISALLRTARTYDATNQAFQRQLQDCHAIFSQILEEEDEVSLVAVSDYFYLNGVRIRATAALLSVYHGLMGEFERRSLGGVRVLQGVGVAELERFFQLFMAAEDPVLAERLAEAVTEASIQHIVPVPTVALDDDDLTRSLEDEQSADGERGRAKRVFWRAVLGTKKIVLRAKQTGRPDLRHAKRLVQPLVDSVMRHEYSIVGLTALKDHDEYTYAHCVNVSILSVSMGQVLGLSRQALADLGVSALLHDIGKISVPGDVLRKPASLTADEWSQMRRHPLEGLKMLTRLPGLSPLTLDSMRVCLEHHMNFDRTGYPDIAHEWGQATLSRIVAVADCFDAITAHRAYHKRPRSSFEGLQYMMGPIRVQFDPAVLWALVRTVGLYPAGSVLTTQSGAVVLSLSPNPKDLRRPHCRVLVRPDGTSAPDDQPEHWDPMPDSENVLRVLKPEEYSVPTGDMLAA
ncbi:MAG TPA: HD domain-containing phosphohydrolase [Candidatus Saccharimonadaceae bacterium]|nr:HD domain-containing phosphohydrolase [Candidatus Saccharimonadaceae bacterium]